MLCHQMRRPYLRFHRAALSEGKAVIITSSGIRLPLRQEVHLNGKPKNGDEVHLWTDLSCFTTFESPTLNGLRANEFLDLTEYARNTISVHTGGLLLVAGYPSETTVLNGAKIERHPSALLGFYGGPSESKHCHVFRRLVGGCLDPNGLSGSPVFALRFEGQRLVRANVIGLVVQGGKHHAEIRFVGISIILQLAQEITAQLNSCKHAEQEAVQRSIEASG